MHDHISRKNVYRIRVPAAVAFFVYLLGVRLLPYVMHRFGMELDPSISWYPWNFTPAFAICLFTGAFCIDRRVSVALPLLTFLISDLGIWALTGRFDWAFYPHQFAVYWCLFCCTAFGFLLRDNHGAARITAAGLSGCTLFFVVTNFASWALLDTYPHTPEGLQACYVAAIPYYRNSLLGTAVFTAALFSPVCVRKAAAVSSGQIAAGQAH